MDNFKHDNQEVIATAQKLISSFKGISKGITDKAKARKAQQTADAGQYWSLRPYLKSLIPIPEYILDQVKDQGINEYAVVMLPAQVTSGTTPALLEKLKAISVAPLPSNTEAKIAALRGNWIQSAIVPSAPQQVAESQIGTGEKAITAVRQYLPWVAIAVTAIFMVYYFSKNR